MRRSQAGRAESWMGRTSCLPQRERRSRARQRGCRSCGTCEWACSRFYVLQAVGSVGEGGSVDQLNASGGEFTLDGGDGAVEVDGAAGVAQDERFEAETAGVECGVADAVVVGEAGQEDAGEVAFAQVSAEAGGGGAVILEEGGVGVDGAAKAFAEDEFGAGELECGMEVGSARALDAVV